MPVTAIPPDKPTPHQAKPLNVLKQQEARESKVSVKGGAAKVKPGAPSQGTQWH